MKENDYKITHYLGVQIVYEEDGYYNAPALKDFPQWTFTSLELVKLWLQHYYLTKPIDKVKGVSGYISDGAIEMVTNPCYYN